MSSSRTPAFGLVQLSSFTTPAFELIQMPSFSTPAIELIQKSSFRTAAIAWVKPVGLGLFFSFSPFVLPSPTPLAAPTILSLLRPRRLFSSPPLLLRLLRSPPKRWSPCSSFSSPYSSNGFPLLSYYFWLMGVSQLKRVLNVESHSVFQVIFVSYYNNLLIKLLFVIWS